MGYLERLMMNLDPDLPPDAFQIMKERLFHNSGMCPFCSSVDLSRSLSSIQDSSEEMVMLATIVVFCRSCEGTWSHVMAHLQIVQVGVGCEPID